MRTFSPSIFTRLAVLWGGLLFSLPLSIGQITSAQALIPSAVQTVDIVGDAVVNVTLPIGFLLSGTVTLPRGDPIGPSMVTAQSPTGLYSGQIFTQGEASIYRLALPADTYDLGLSVSFIDTEAEPPALVYTATTAMTGLGVAADTSQNLTAPALPPLATVSGLVTAQDTVPANGALRFVSLNGSVFTIALFENDYVTRLPLDTYAVSAELIFTENAVQPQTTASVMVNLDPVTLTGDSTFHDVTLPATVQLSGTVADARGAPVAPAVVVVSATRMSVPAHIDFSCRSSATFSPEPVAVSGAAMIHRQTGLGEPNTTGDYRMPLPIGTYHLGVTLGLALQPGIAPTLVALDASPSGILHIAASRPELSLAADTTENLIAPALPPVVMLSGQVTDAQGQPVGNAFVKAITSTLAGVSNATFFATARTRDDGAYTLPVLSGTGYQILACPPDST